MRRSRLLSGILLGIALSFVGSLAALEARTWTEASTGRAIEAEYRSADDQSVTLVLADGREFTIELDRLAPGDREFVAEQRKIALLESRRPLADLFEAPMFDAEDVPVTGTAHPALSDLDEGIRSYMAERGIGALSLAVSRDGEILHQRAFGWANSDFKEPLSVETRLRMASVTKPVVAAVVKTLFAMETLSPDALVYELLNLDQYPEAKDADLRWKKVTVQQLLDHCGGWETDFTFRSSAIIESLGIDLEEMKPIHVVRYALTQPMEFEPGEKESYCNLGYILLVRVVEAVSGQDFIAFLQDTIGAESGASAWNWSTADAPDRNPQEGWYVYHPEYAEPVVPLPSRTQAGDGAGGLACTPADYCRFLESYWISGDRRQGSARYSFSGSLAGVTAVVGQRPDGLNFAAFANRRDQSGSTWNAELAALINEALDQTSSELGL